MPGFFDSKDRAMQRRWHEIFHFLEMSDARFRRLCNLSREQQEHASLNGDRRQFKNSTKEQQFLADIGRMRHGLKAAGWLPPSNHLGDLKIAESEDMPKRAAG